MLNRLIKNQQISFDTHQAGDGQEVKWKNVHLEKKSISKRGKVRFPLFGQEKPSNSGMNDRDFQKITSEIKKVLSKNKPLVKELAEELVRQMKRFSHSQADLQDAEEAAKRFSGYFGLSPEFEDTMVKYGKREGMHKSESLIEFTSIHYSEEAAHFYAIHQSKDKIVIQRRRTGKFSSGRFEAWNS